MKTATGAAKLCVAMSVALPTLVGLCAAVTGGDHQYSYLGLFIACCVILRWGNVLLMMRKQRWLMNDQLWGCCCKHQGERRVEDAPQSGAVYMSNVPKGVPREGRGGTCWECGGLWH